MHRLTYQFLFFFIDKFVSFLTYVNGGSLQTLTANESSFRQREKQTEKAEELRRNGNLTEARKALAAGAEISHDHVRGFIEVSSAVFRLCFKRRFIFYRERHETLFFGLFHLNRKDEEF